MIIIRIFTDICLLAGAFFALTGVVGMLRFKGTMERLQASTCISTLGLLLGAAGGFLQAIFVWHNTTMAVKIVLIVVFVMLTNPVANHAIARAAYRRGLSHDERDRLLRDDYGRDEPYND